MIINDYLVKLHIYKRAKQFKTPKPKNIEKILTNIKEKEPLKQHDFRFNWFMDLGWNQVGGHITYKYNIEVNAEWAARLVLYNNNPNVLNAFIITIGHEATHKENDYKLLKQLRKINKKFINWVDEVHADYGAAQKMANCSRDRLVSSINYKMDVKKCSLSLKDSVTHPSWQRRKYYAENFNFNKELIKQIAKDVGCTDEKLIQKVCNYYDDIILI